jgi:F-type H+-transporting ATPase subunit a
MPENKGNKPNKVLTFCSALVLSMVLFTGFSVKAGGSNHEEKTYNHESFNPGDMILEHIKDSYDWHIMDIHGHPISVPLPIIVYDSKNGFNAFFSSRFDHGHTPYKGYELVHDKKLARLVLKRTDDSSFYDFSITKNVATIMFGFTLLVLIFIHVARGYVKRAGKAPKGIQSFIEPIIIFIRDEVAKPSIGSKYEKFLPFLLTMFFFIWIVNLLGLIPFFPGGANVTGNISVTLVLATFTFIITTINGNKYYWKHIFLPDVPVGLYILMIPIEIIGVVLKPLVLMLRLFANITAGHIIILGFFSLIFIFGEMSKGLGLGVGVFSVAFTLFMSFLELLVAFLQAYVFTLLSALYFGMAVEEHHHGEEKH